MRVTQRTMYSNIIAQNNRALSKLQELSYQSMTEKKVNRPSDDPAGTTNIFNLRASLSNLSNYSNNIDTAKGWLTLADGLLQQVSTQIIEAKTKDLQGSTGTLGADNREQIATQLRQIFEQLMVVGNSTFNGQYIFGGHKTDTPPYEEALNAMSYYQPNPEDAKSGLAGVEFEVEGDKSRSTVVQFLDDDVIESDTGLDYRYSDDGGKTWNTGTTTSNDAGDAVLDLNGVVVTMHGSDGREIAAVDPEDLNETDNGTWLWVYPTAKYVGDDEDSVEVDSYSGSGAVATADGDFSREVAVRIDKVDDTVTPNVLTYSYTTDAGETWSEGSTAEIDSTTKTARLLVPGGYLNLDATAGYPNVDDQFFIRPRRAEIKVDIAQGESLTINQVGKNIFGGIYQDPNDPYAKPIYDGDGRNLMETMGRLIAFAENNNQEGFQRELAKLEDAHKVVMNHAANVGGRLNRADVAQGTIEVIGGSESQAMSNIENVDFIELMTRLAQQELVYQSVLKSSTMLMQLSLLNFL